MTAADELRQAAAKVRDTAAKATPGPWWGAKRTEEKKAYRHIDPFEARRRGLIQPGKPFPRLAAVLTEPFSAYGTHKSMMQNKASRLVVWTRNTTAHHWATA